MKILKAIVATIAVSLPTFAAAAEKVDFYMSFSSGGLIPTTEVKNVRCPAICTLGGASRTVRVSSSADGTYNVDYEIDNASDPSHPTHYSKVAHSDERVKFPDGATVHVSLTEQLQ